MDGLKLLTNSGNSAYTFDLLNYCSLCCEPLGIIGKHVEGQIWMDSIRRVMYGIDILSISEG